MQEAIDDRRQGAAHHVGRAPPPAWVHDPTRVHTGPPGRGRSYAVVPGEAFADDMTSEEQSRFNVCEAVERHVASLRLFASQWNATPTTPRSGTVAWWARCTGTGGATAQHAHPVHAVLQGTAEFMIERTVNEAARAKKPTAAEEGWDQGESGAVFAGSRYATRQCV